MTKSTSAAIFTLLTVCCATLADDAARLGETGAFRVEFTARSLFSERQGEVYGDFISMDEVITWEIYVPDTYDPSKPAGVLTWVSPTRSGRIPETWKPVLDERNLIWVAANRSGNGAGSVTRTIYAILGTELIRNAYETDDARLYVSGFSGGGRMSSILMQQYGHIYTGAIYVCGVNLWEDDTPDANRQLMRKRRHVFLTGTKDFNYRDTMNALNQYRQAGLRQYSLMVIDGMGHRLPGPEDYGKALQFLDGESEGS